MPTNTSTSKSFYYDIDLQRNSLLNAKLQNVSTAERTAMISSLNGDNAGMVVYDQDEKGIYIWDGNQWLATSTGGQDITNWDTAYERSIAAAEVTSDETTDTLVLTRQDDTTVEASWVNRFVYEQAQPSATWNIVHDLNKYPSVTIVDSANSEVFGEVLYVSSNIITVSFSAAFSGRAYLN